MDIEKVWLEGLLELTKGIPKRQKDLKITCLLGYIESIREDVEQEKRKEERND